MCKTVKLAINNCTKRLATKGFEIGTEEKLKQVAEGYEINPVGVLKMLLIPDYKPED